MILGWSLGSGALMVAGQYAVRVPRSTTARLEDINNPCVRYSYREHAALPNDIGEEESRPGTMSSWYGLNHFRLLAISSLLPVVVFGIVQMLEDSIAHRLEFDASTRAMKAWRINSGLVVNRS